MSPTRASRANGPMDASSTASSYDRLSRWYDLMSGPFESHWRGLTLRRLDLAAGQSVLEIGSGTGTGLVALAEATGTSGIVCGIDLSAGMCKVARTRLARSGHPEVTVLRGDARTLPFETGCFDAVFMSFTLELFDDAMAARVLSECRRALAVGGRLGVVALERREPRTFVARLYDRASRRFPAWIDCHPIPVADVVSGSGFRPIDVIRGAMAGLPVASLIACTVD